MSVIAKLYAESATINAYVDTWALKCVAENEFMAGYAKHNEDVLFTQYSPWGEMSLSIKGDARPKLEPGRKYYAIFTKEPQLHAFLWDRVRVASITDFGGTSKKVEFGNKGRPYSSELRREADPEPKQLYTFNFKIMIDNPGASNQFEAGDETWYVGLYDAEVYTDTAAVALAHEAASPAPEEEPSVS